MKLFTLIGALLLTLTTHAAPTVGGLPVPTFSSADANGVLSSIPNASGRTVAWTSSTTSTISFTNEVSGITLAGNTTVTLADVPTSTNIDKAITIQVNGNDAYTLALTGVTVVGTTNTLIPPSGLSEVTVRWEAGGTNAYPSWIARSQEIVIDRQARGTWYSLTLSGTNVLWDVSRIQNARLYLTNNAFLILTNSVVTTNWAKPLALSVLQDGTGSRTLTFQTNQFKWPGGTIPTITTNAGAIDLISFYKGPWTNGWFYGVQTADLK